MISMSLFSRLAARAAILLAAGTLAACQVEVDEGRPDYRPRPQACTMEYMPVCGSRGGETQTFPNACEARSNGYRIVGRGECRFGVRPDPYPDQGRACTREYAPVCGSRGRDRQTFANACEARSSGYDVIGRGECQFSRPDTGWEDNRERPRDRVKIGWQDQSDDRASTWDRAREDRSDRDRNRDRERDRKGKDRERSDNKRQDADIRLGLDDSGTRADRSGREEREDPRCADKRRAKRDPACAVN
ncbi:Kazal-type serine protease inhibitor family protein [Shinella sp. M31]|uniref:Kazal-type serine protease inhibitor family protein n=1 Tax=Shinella sp. M31 TaxID=3368615 RepID=UPI003BA140CB